MRYLLGGLLLILLSSCAPPVSQAPVKLEGDSLRLQLQQLPGVKVQSEDPLGFSYPDQVMFAAGAVLPMPGGPKLLDPLAAFLQQSPGVIWQVEVRAQTEHGTAYDQALAEKRSELLASYLLSKGVALKNLHFQPEAADGAALVFTQIESAKSNQ